MSGIVDALAVLKTRLATIDGIVTVLDFVEEKDLAAAELPAIMMKVNGAHPNHPGDGSTGGYMDRRTIFWPVDLYFFGCIRSNNIAVDMALVLPYWEAIVGSLDSNLGLSQTLDGPMYWPDPMGGDPGAIGWVKQVYTGFVLHLYLPIRTDTDYHA